MKAYIYSLAISLLFSVLGLAFEGISRNAFIPFTLFLSLIIYFVYFRKKTINKKKSLSNNYDEIKLNNHSNLTVKFRRNYGRPEFNVQADVMALSPKTYLKVGAYHDTWIEIYKNGRWEKLHRVNHESSESRVVQQMTGVDLY